MKNKMLNPLAVPLCQNGRSGTGSGGSGAGSGETGKSGTGSGLNGVSGVRRPVHKSCAPNMCMLQKCCRSVLTQWIPPQSGQR